MTKMKWPRQHLFILIFSTLLSGSWVSAAAQAAPDNTKVNAADVDKSQPTADHQNNSKSDLQITQQIRQAVVKDKSLSTYAHNVKIISQNGMVTLKGPVRSDDEKRAVEAKAAEVVGQDKITSELQVAPKK